MASIRALFSYIVFLYPVCVGVKMMRSPTFQRTVSARTISLERLGRLAELPTYGS
jgi:hypothetical protein